MRPFKRYRVKPGMTALFDFLLITFYFFFILQHGIPLYWRGTEGEAIQEIPGQARHDGSFEFLLITFYFFFILQHGIPLFWRGAEGEVIQEIPGQARHDGSFKFYL